MTLSIVFACLNDPVNAAETIASIRATAGHKVQIVVVDDASNTPLFAMLPQEARQGAVILQNQYRCGCGPSRHIGVCHASGDYVLICDSHMVFMPGWYEAWEECVSYHPTDTVQAKESTVWCAACPAIDSKNTDPNHPVTTYTGGTLNIFGPDKANRALTQVLEGIWHPPPVENEAEIACVMGAGYFLRRDWFLRMDPLRFLKQWGCDEQMLSIKSWLMGGSCRFAANVKIAHKFLNKGENQPFRVMPGYPAWNKVFAIQTLCPPNMIGFLMEEFRKTVSPKEWAITEQMVKNDWYIIAAEQARNRRMFTRGLRLLAEKFNLPCP